MADIGLPKLPTMELDSWSITPSCPRYQGMYAATYTTHVPQQLQSFSLYLSCRHLIDELKDTTP